jgi:hypothetical protein
MIVKGHSVLRDKKTVLSVKIFNYTPIYIFKHPLH